MSPRGAFALGAVVGLGALAVAGACGLSFVLGAPQARAAATGTRDLTLSIGPIQGTFVESEFSTEYSFTVFEQTKQVPLSYAWTLDLKQIDPDGSQYPGLPDSRAAFDPNCNNRVLKDGAGAAKKLSESSTEAVYEWTQLKDKFTWHHGDVGADNQDAAYGCDHKKMGPSGHQGVVKIVVSDGSTLCTASFKGTNSFNPYDVASGYPNTGPAGVPSCTAIPAAKNCDKERLTLAEAKARLKAFEEVRAEAEKDVEKSIAAAEAAAKVVSDLQGKSHGLSRTEIDGAQADLNVATGKLAAATAALRKILDKVDQAREEVSRAEVALQNCERGRSVQVAAPLSTTRLVACGSEQLVADAASARLHAFQEALALIGSANFELARKSALDAQGHLRRALALLPASAPAAPVRHEIEKAIAMFGHVVASLGRVEADLRAIKARASAAKASSTAAKQALAKCRAVPPPPPPISEADTWTYNTAIGKANVCINIRTAPPQTSITATLTGPGGYKARLPKSPLRSDGTGQIRGEITQAGSYTDTVAVYDATGAQTATTTNTFTVAASPQDGPAPTFGSPCPQPTQ